MLRFHTCLALAALSSSMLVACGRAHQRPAEDEDVSPPALPEARALSPRLSCAPAATTFVELAANLDASTPPPVAWDPIDPAGTSNFSSTIALYDRRGTRCDMTMYFRSAGAAQWEMHGMIGGTYTHGGIEIVNGTLSFTQDGALDAAWISSMELPALDGGDATVIELSVGTPIAEGGDGLDGITQFGTPCHVTRIDHDGRAAEVGVACEDRSATAIVSDQPAPALGNGLASHGEVACFSDPTRSIAVTTNLHADAEIIAAPWDALDPNHTSNTWAELSLVNDRGVRAAVALYFRRVAVQRWEYRVLLGSDQARSDQAHDDPTGEELGSGTLVFNAVGALRSHVVEQPLRFPNPDGSWGDVIDLSFGPALDEGGNGVDGTTGFATAFTGLDLAVHGMGPRLDGPCPTDAATFHTRLHVANEAPTEWPWAESWLPSCAGVATRDVSASIALPPTAALATSEWNPATPERDAYVASTSIFDSTARPWTLSLYFRRLSETQWDYHALLQAEDGTVTHIGDSRLSFGDGGVLDAMGPALSLRLPLPDGSDGPLITIDLGDPGALPTGENRIYRVTTWGDAFRGNVYNHGRATQAADTCMHDSFSVRD